ncbi:MAG: helix-turn-helix transcriptional regulator [Bacteroidota bacterium]
MKLNSSDEYHLDWLFQYDEKRQRFLASNPKVTQQNIRIIDVKSGRSFQTNFKDQESFLCIDNNGLIWVSHKDGITLVEYAESPFTYYKDVVNARGIWANDEKMVVASSHLQDYIYDIDKPNQPTEFNVNNGIYYIANDKKAFWAGKTGSFSKIDLPTKKTLETVHLKKIEDYGLIWAALRDSEGNWWLEQDIFKYKSDLYFYNPTKQDSADIFNQYNEFEVLKNAFVIHFLEDKNIIWASSNMGIIRIDKQKGVVGLYNKKVERLAFLEEENGKKQVSDTFEVSDTLIPESDQNWLTELETLVTENLNNSQFTVAACAKKFYISERQLQRRIKKYTGLSFVKYLRLARLKKARQLLESSEMTTIAEVAYAVGFETPAYSSKVFYKEFGKRPTDYF